jgi:hypothetical protein
VRLDAKQLQEAWGYVSPLKIPDDRLLEIERKLYEKRQWADEQAYRYNLAVKLSDYAHMLKSQH